MSRISKIAINIPNDVIINIIDKTIYIKGPLNSLKYKIHNLIKIKLINNKLIFKSNKHIKNYNELIGTIRSLLKNMIIGVTIGFTKKLQLIGIGYKVSINNNIINLLIGFSHPIKYKIPDNIIAKCNNKNEIILSGPDKQQIGQTAADIRSFRPPEPYKGKGIRYYNEKIIIKETKKK